MLHHRRVPASSAPRSPFSVGQGPRPPNAAQPTVLSIINPLWAPPRGRRSLRAPPESLLTRVLFALVLFRVANTLLVQSYFNPDEFWQGPEVAHRIAFGYGHLTWEWSGAARLRSCVHPLIFAGLYRALRALGCDSRWAVAWAPRLLQAAIAGLGDLCVYRLGARVFGERAGRWALACSLTSWFNFYCKFKIL